MEGGGGEGWSRWPSSWTLTKPGVCIAPEWWRKYVSSSGLGEEGARDGPDRRTYSVSAPHSTNIGKP